MKILYIAFACNPYTGSEAYCGWSWPINMRNKADVYVLTRKENRKSIEKFLQEKNVTNITFIYYDLPEHINFYYKYRKFYNLYYMLWIKFSRKTVKEIVQKYKIDVIHHITLGDYRIIGKYYGVGAKTIFGPVGGAQTTPKVFKEYVNKNAIGEIVRKLVNTILTNRYSYKKALNKFDYIFAANKETQNDIKLKIKNNYKCKLLTENGVSSEKLVNILKDDSNEKIHILWAGRVINKKGLLFLLDVISIINTNRKFILDIVGEGPELVQLKEKVKNLKLNDKVDFKGKISFDEMKEIYKNADMFVFPSFRETTGTVLFEAMSYSLPVITFNQNGADLLIDENCGIKIDINQKLDDIKKEFAKSIKLLIENSQLRIILGKNAYQKVKENYTWEVKCDSFLKEYLK